MRRGGKYEKPEIPVICAAYWAVSLSATLPLMNACLGSARLENPDLSEGFPIILTHLASVKVEETNPVCSVNKLAAQPVEVF